jgi:hypothetical protein
MIDIRALSQPTEPGWYIARMKTWAINTGYAPVKVTRNESAGPFQVWQCADERPWSVEDWDWCARIWP